MGKLLLAAAVLLLNLLELPGWEGATVESLTGARPARFYRSSSLSRKNRARSVRRS